MAFTGVKGPKQNAKASQTHCKFKKKMFTDQKRKRKCFPRFLLCIIVIINLFIGKNSSFIQ